MKLSLPINKEALQELRIGDVVLLSGYIYTARDAAHDRIARALAQGESPPFDLKNQIIYYAGPCPPAPGFVTGPIGPTTSTRMDSYVRLMFEQGVSAMIGKGNRSPTVVPLHKEFGGVYFMGIGGAAAIAMSNVKSVEVIAYDDLGPESVKRLYVDELKVIVGIDTRGEVLCDREIAKYRRA